MAWRTRALSRSLGTVTERSLERAERFVGAARELVEKTERLEFTVQEVVARSGLSLRSFYQHFESKEDLLLALFEELVRDAAARASKRLVRIGEPEARLRFLVERFYSGRGALAAPTSAEIQGLAEARPEDLRAALEPLVSLFAEVIAGAQAAGVARAGDPREHALHLLLVVMMHTQTRAQGLMGGDWPTLTREQLWGYCRRALCAD